MFIPFGPALDAELAYRRDDVADSARRTRRPRTRRPGSSAAPAPGVLSRPRTAVHAAGDCPASAA